jgi:hypothetical protein
MKKPGIILFIVLLAVIIVIIIIRDLRSTRPGNRTDNKYELDLDDYNNVDTSLIRYKETRNYTISADSLRGIACYGQKIYIVADNFLQAFNLKGNQLLKTTLPYKPTCLDIAEEGKIVVGFRNRIGLFNDSGVQIWVTDTLNSRAVITAIAVKGLLIFVADAGNRVVHRFDTSGSYINSFEGKTGGNGAHGFIVPSAYFDLKINRNGVLWVVNPGKHAFENYTYEGDLKISWGKSSVRLEGFSGCCNPAHFTFIPDGSFVTSEKLLVRIKIHKPSGEFLSVVASPEKFEENGKAPDVATDDYGNIYALDYDRKIIRVFAPK